MKKVLLMTCIIVLITLIGCSNAANQAIAECLTEKDVRMYGAYWCGACSNQKDLFGAAFNYVDYTECSLPNRAGTTQICIDERIENYPTWVFPDGERITGVKSPEFLAQKVGCLV